MRYIVNETTVTVVYKNVPHIFDKSCWEYDELKKILSKEIIDENEVKNIIKKRLIDATMDLLFNKDINLFE